MSDARDPAHRPGESIGSFRVLGVIGEGGFGIVYEAEQVEPVRRRVALKIIKPGMDTRAVIARFEAERQSLAVMDHPNIARVLDGGATPDGRPYFAMELVRGEPITAFCDKQRFSLDQRIGLFISVCDAVQHAHMKGIIHRDLKPSNILVEYDDASGRANPKVIDFGVAKALHQRMTELTVYTQHGQLIGTPAYMSPEQAEMSGLDVDTRSDIYSLGVVLYELLAGAPPFDAKTLASAGLAEIQRIIREVDPPRPSTKLSAAEEKTGRAGVVASRASNLRDLRTTLQRDLDWIVMKCLEKERSRRYETANGLAMDLHRYLNDEPVLAGPPSVRYKLRKFAKRHRGGILAACVALVLLVGGLAGTSYGLIQAQRARRAAAERAAELEVITAFQDQQLRLLDPVSLAKAVREEMDNAASRLEQDDLTEALAGVNLIDVMRRALVSSVFDSMLESIDARFEDRPVLHARMLHSLSAVLSNLGFRREALEPEQRALAIRRHELGDENADTLSSIDHVRGLFSDLGRGDDAERYARESVELSGRVLGSENPRTLARRTILALTLEQNEKFQEELEELDDVLPICRRTLEPDSGITNDAVRFMATTLQALGRTDEAAPYFDEVIEYHLARCRRGVPGTQSTLDDLDGLAFYLDAAGRPGEAADYAEELVTGRRALLGDEHPLTLTAIGSLGQYLLRDGRLAEAEGALREAVDGQRRALGPDHPARAYAMRNLAEALRRLGRDDEALGVDREFLDLRVRLASVADATAQDLNELAWTLLTNESESLRDPEAALPLAKRAVSLGESEKHVNLWMFVDTLAMARFRNGDVEEAVRLQRRAILLTPPNTPKLSEMKQRLAHFEAQPAGNDPE